MVTIAFVNIIYSLRCTHCKKIEKDLKAVALELKDRGSKAKIAFVDGTAVHNKLLLDNLAVEGFPTIIPFKNGVKLPEYTGLKKQGYFSPVLS